MVEEYAESNVRVGGCGGKNRGREEGERSVRSKVKPTNAKCKWIWIWIWIVDLCLESSIQPET
jgi:hypothetical protein